MGASVAPAASEQEMVLRLKAEARAYTLREEPSKDRRRMKEQLPPPLLPAPSTVIVPKPRLENSSVDSKSNAHVDPTITATGGAVTSSVATASILLSTEDDVAVLSPPTSLPHTTKHGSDVDNSTTTTTFTSDNKNNIPSSNRKQNVNSISDHHNHEDLSTVYDRSRPFVSFDDNATTDTSTIVFDLDENGTIIPRTDTIIEPAL